MARWAPIRCKGSGIAWLAPPIQRDRGAGTFFLICFGIVASSVVIRDRGPMMKVLSTCSSSGIGLSRAAVGRCEGVFPSPLQLPPCALWGPMGGLMGMNVVRRVRAPINSDGLLVGTVIVPPYLRVGGWWGYPRFFITGGACAVTVASGGFRWQHGFRKA